MAVDTFMEFQTKQLSADNGQAALIFSRLSYKKGKAALLAAGFTQCRNQKYFERDTELVHYNSLLKLWIHN